MRFPRIIFESFRIHLLLLLLGIGLVLPVDRVEAGPADDRFTVVGWVKSKLSPEEQARSASRSQRLRPMPVNLSQPPVPQASLSPHVGMAAAMNPAIYPNNPPPPPVAPPPVHQPAPAPLPPPRATPPPSESIGSGRSKSTSSRRQKSRSSGFTGERSVAELRRRAEFLARKGLTYKFGGDHPSEGGMDCSGTMQFLLKSMGYPDIPRTSYNQYSWLKEKGTLRNVGFFHSSERAIKNFKPGDMIFWGGTYNSGHKVSHVMIYLGKSRTGKHFIFGARGKKVKGLNGSGVDVFEYNPRSTGGRLIGYGRLPGLKG